MRPIPAPLPRAATLAAALLALGAAITAPARAQSPFDGLRFRSIGPAVMGGRLHDVEVDPRDPATVYVAAASGGVWKSENKGTTWTPVFDAQEEHSFGDLAISPTDSRQLWAGTGEQNNRQSSSWGGGVYRSADGGATWRYAGLRATRHIARVVLHPRNPEVAWVAALGDLWAPSADRGVYRTTDGGATWQRVLFVDSLTGATELVVDPRDPAILYAATYQRLRSAFGFNGGGPGSALWKSVDGGTTWRQLGSGLPEGDKGRIGLAIAASRPDVLVATIEHGGQGGVYRTDDAALTWRRVSPTNPRPMYYSKPVIDPTTDQRVWLMGVQPWKSEDGGATFEQMPNSPTYDLGLKDDHHALWIDPANPRHLLLAGDGGLHESFDLGYTYARLNNFAVGQFYRIAVDDRDPYWIYGGMQDAHSWMGPSATTHWLGILNSDWVQIGFSDGTGQAVDKAGPRYVYSTSSGGSLTRVDALTGDRYNIQPMAPAGERYRFDWTAPVLASRHRAGTVYLGANRLLISTDFGGSWRATPDLTRQVNRDTLRMAGVRNSDIRLSRNDGESAFSEITTVAESPRTPLVLWVGTDDGNVQVSRDGGATWTEVGRNIGGLPDGSFIDRIVASEASPGTAVVAADNHRRGRYEPLLFRTTDYGASWTRITAGLPDGNPVRSLAEFPGRPDVLFAGTERFLHVSRDSGATWTRVKANLPPMRIDDIVVHPRTKDLVLGTHGRAIWVLDDATPFTTLAAETPAGGTLLPVRPATLVLHRADVSTAAHAIYAAENPPEGAVFTYRLAAPAASVRFTVRNAAGRVVREFTGPGAAGVLQRVTWDLRHPPVAGGFGGGFGEEGDAPPGAGMGRGGASRGPSRPALPLPVHTIGPRGITVAPGAYTVTMTVDGAAQVQPFTVRADPSLGIAQRDHEAREAFLLEVLDVQARLQGASTAFRAKVAAATGDEAARLQALATRLGVGGGVRGGGRGMGGMGAAPGAALGGIVAGYNGSGVRQGSLLPPTTAQRAALAEAKGVLAALEAEVPPAAPPAK
ncbi:MAG: hypothetical protein KJT01_07075 [Gemmatimonadetes bacterium]|nr:hypothetical protein [Gemmatimonadota bacterium]